MHFEEPAHLGFEFPVAPRALLWFSRTWCWTPAVAVKVLRLPLHVRYLPTATTPDVLRTTVGGPAIAAAVATAATATAAVASAPVS